MIVVLVVALVIYFLPGVIILVDVCLLGNE